MRKTSTARSRILSLMLLSLFVTSLFFVGCGDNASVTEPDLGGDQPLSPLGSSGWYGTAGGNGGGNGSDSDTTGAPVDTTFTEDTWDFNYLNRIPGDGTADW